MYKGKVFVIKASGGVFGDAAATRALIEQVAILHQVGIRVVLVHGGGPQLTQVQESLGLTPRMVAGRRVTDGKSMEVTSMVLNGLVNTQILGICRELDIAAVGVSGVDAGLVRAHKRPPVSVEGQMVDYGFVGDIDLIDAKVLQQLLDDGLMPVVSPCRPTTRARCSTSTPTRSRPGSARLEGREADAVHRRARHSRIARRSAFDHFVHRSRGARAPRERKADSRTACCRRPRRSKTRSAAACVACTSRRTSIAGQHPRGSIHERRHGHADRREHQRSVAGGAARAEHEPPVGQGLRSTSASCATRPARITRSTIGSSPTTCAHRSRTRKCSTLRGC